MAGFVGTKFRNFTNLKGTKEIVGKKFVHIQNDVNVLRLHAHLFSPAQGYVLMQLLSE
jgi:hypothetical protein